MENAVAGLLKHFGVGVEAGVAKFSNSLCEELNSVRRVAKDDGLVDLQLREEGVEAVDLLFLINEAIVLCDTAQCKLIHQVDFVRVSHVFVLSRNQPWLPMGLFLHLP